jgi:hypothetical protein
MHVTDKTEIIRAYRFFDVSSDGTIRSHLGDLAWPAPNGRPGEWVKHAGACVLCKTGLHASPTVYDALQNRQGTELGAVDVREIEASDESKFSARQMRIVEIYSRKKLVGLAGCAAAMVLPLFAEKYAADQRPRRAIEAVIAWLDTQPGSAAAAWSAAAAAWSAAAAAWSAAWLDTQPGSAAPAAAAAWSAAADARSAARNRPVRAACKQWRENFERHAQAILALPNAELGAYIMALLKAPCVNG